MSHVYYVPNHARKGLLFDRLGCAQRTEKALLYRRDTIVSDAPKQQNKRKLLTFVLIIF